MRLFRTLPILAALSIGTISCDKSDSNKSEDGNRDCNWELMQNMLPDGYMTLYKELDLNTDEITYTYFKTKHLDANTIEQTFGSFETLDNLEESIANDTFSIAMERNTVCQNAADGASDDSDSDDFDLDEGEQTREPSIALNVSGRTLDPIVHVKEYDKDGVLQWELFDYESPVAITSFGGLDLPFTMTVRSIDYDVQGNMESTRELVDFQLPEGY
ncbi:MAG: hypothetical protein HRU19_05845 [Pseudobacteriovorax sp.]|nr:hypothetical protein [Pseudobacteriovorax sp.]